ncbi:hypothetical protein G7Y89_g4553 [Cudoniella acicularis]|uniref:Uncharacterized protein n=1 Tax=Cudoniella acicularis TaxID=354080 RepID=A0A8H4RQI5_9HELO|nr:hypothetical protein G7Y89_g4553 [Cudoniella acicularis]
MMDITQGLGKEDQLWILKNRTQSLTTNPLTISRRSTHLCQKTHLNRNFQANPLAPIHQVYHHSDASVHPLRLSSITYRIPHITNPGYSATYTQGLINAYGFPEEPAAQQDLESAIVNEALARVQGSVSQYGGEVEYE